MVTIKQEIDEQRMDLDEGDSSGGVNPGFPSLPDNYSARPQEVIEPELQITPWGPILNPQIKSADRVTPTILDRYQAALSLQKDQAKRSEMSVGGEEKRLAPASASALTAEQQRNADYQFQLMRLEQQNRIRRSIMDAVDRPSSSISGANWKPPPGWRESLAPESRRALEFLEKQHSQRTERDKGVPEDREEMAIQLPQGQGFHQVPAKVFTPESTPSVREQSVDSIWSMNFTPESTPGFQEGQHTLESQAMMPPGRSCPVLPHYDQNSNPLDVRQNEHQGSFDGRLGTQLAPPHDPIHQWRETHPTVTPEPRSEGPFTVEKDVGNFRKQTLAIRERVTGDGDKCN